MKNQRTRTYSIIALVVLLAATTTGLGISAANAQAANYQQTYAFLVVNPNPAGRGQDVFIFMFLSNLQASAGGTGGARFHNFTVEITKPDSSRETRGPYTADPVSSAYFMYRPDQLGNYTMVFKYPGEFTPQTTGPGGTSPPTTFSASQSAAVTLTVQENALPVLEGNPAPTSYWTRPINGQNWHWGGYSGSWLMAAWDSTGRQFDQGSTYVPYGIAPNSAHVLWTAPMTFGGIVGGEFGNVQFTDGRSYEQFFKPPIVIGGRLYYNTIQAEEPVTTVNYTSVTCVDMKNGKTIFTIPNMTLTFGQIYNYVSPNQAGALAYLWEVRGSTWRMFDAWTGNPILSIAGVPSGTTLLSNTFYGTTGQGAGDVLVYGLSGSQTARSLVLWNSSLCIPKLGDTGTNFWQWRPYQFVGLTLNAVGNTTLPNGQIRNSNGIQYNVTLQDFPVGGSIIQVGYDNEVIVANGSSLVGTIFAQGPVRTFVAYDMKTGAKLWGPTTIDFTTRVPANATLYQSSVIGMAQRQVGPGDILPIWAKEVGAFYCWNIRTGQFLWGPSTPSATDNNGFALYNWESKLITPDGYLFNWGYDGVINAFNLTTGTRIWTFSTGNAGLNTPYGTWPIYNGINIIDGKLYLQTSDHGNGVTPLYQGEGLYCLDYKTGRQIWNITGWWEQPAIADGKYMAHNCYDNQIYAIGKGPSKVTLTATPSIQTKGSAIMIQGTAADISPGAQEKVANGEFNIIPLIADEIQGTYMNYIYQQQACPADQRGVPIHLTAVDPNGNPQDLGYVTSDPYGRFSKMWTPDLNGVYSITATFEGSNSYWPSFDQTAVGIEAAPAPSITPTPPPTSPPPTVVTPTPSQIVTPTPTSPAPTPPAAPVPVEIYVAIAAAVVIIAVIAAAVILRRRK